MKHVWQKPIAIAAIAAVTVILAMSGCIFRNGDLVINETICANIDEVETTGEFTTFTVVDKFKDVLERKLEQHGRGKKDVKSIHMVSATFKTMAVKDHDWVVTGDINIARQDVPDGPFDDGPAPLVVFEDQSLRELKGRPTDADLLSDGVDLIDRALESLLLEEDPRLVLLVENETVDPTPSEADPMEFKVRVCVTFQMVVDLGKKDK